MIKHENQNLLKNLVIRAAELSIRAGAVALVLLLWACGPSTAMPSLKENVHARPAPSHKCYRLLHLALPPTVKLIDNPAGAS